MSGRPPAGASRPGSGASAALLSRAALLALLSSTALLLAATPAAAAPPRVAILDPGPFDAVSGEVRVRVGVTSEEPVVSVQILVDGIEVSELAAPPWEVTVDLGAANREHEFRAIARTSSGESGVMSLHTPAIEVDEEIELPLQQLFVTVDRARSGPGGLLRGDFTVVDDGRAQQLVTFEGGDAPLTALLLLDSSESMRGERLDAALRGVEAFTAGMRDLDEAKTLLFADELVRATPFTDEPEVLRAALAGAQATGGTALTDHLYAALKLLDGRQGRRVIVVLTDGFDVYSALSMADVEWKAQRSQAIIYWIQLQDQGAAGTEPGRFISTWRDADTNFEEYETLRRIVVESGGRIAPITQIGQIEDAFESILTELREQYVLGYYPTGLRRDGSWRRVRVRVRGASRVRVREGYVDF